MTDAEIIEKLRHPTKGSSGTVRWAAAAAIERLTAERDALRAAVAMKPGEPNAEDVAWAETALADLGDALDADESAALRGDAAELAEIGNLLPGYCYMDPPDGGDVSISEQVRRMSKDAARYRWLRQKVCGIRGKGFEFVNLPPMPDTWYRGSIAEHFDNAIDAATAQAAR